MLRHWPLTSLVAAALLWGVAALAAPQGHAGKVVSVRMMSDRTGSDVWFDPIGVYVEPGTTIRWEIHSNAHSTTAYHPRNEHRELRIPIGATPWDSSVMANRGEHFEVRLTVPGTYDYFCIPHEESGMVGRIVVGRPGGPGSQPFGYDKTHRWKPVPGAARKAFPSVERIVREKVVHRSR